MTRSDGESEYTEPGYGPDAVRAIVRDKDEAAIREAFNNELDPAATVILLRAAKFTSGLVAKCVGVPESDVGYWANDRDKPTPSQEEKLSILRQSVGFLLGRGAPLDGVRFFFVGFGVVDDEEAVYLTADPRRVHELLASDQPEHRERYKRQLVKAGIAQKKLTEK